MLPLLCLETLRVTENLRPGPKNSRILSSVFQEASEGAGTTRSQKFHPLPLIISRSVPLFAQSLVWQLSILFAAALSSKSLALILYSFLSPKVHLSQGLYDSFAFLPVSSLLSPPFIMSPR